MILIIIILTQLLSLNNKPKNINMSEQLYLSTAFPVVYQPLPYWIIQQPIHYFLIPMVNSINSEIVQATLDQWDNFKNLEGIIKRINALSSDTNNLDWSLCNKNYSEQTCCSMNLNHFCHWNTEWANIIKQSGSQELGSISLQSLIKNLNHAWTPVASKSSDKESEMDEQEKREEDDELSHYALQGYKYKIFYTVEAGWKKINFTWAYQGWNKKFGKTWNFLDHARMHEGIKPYRWEFCLREFTQKGNMLKHRRQHVNSNIEDRKSHSCPYWLKKYTEKYNLKVSKCWTVEIIWLIVRFYVTSYLNIDLFKFSYKNDFMRQ